MDVFDELQERCKCVKHNFNGHIPCLQCEWEQIQADKHTEVINVLNWMKRQGLMWNYDNAATPAEEIYQMYKDSK